MRYPVESCYVGVDVSKERLDVAFRPASRHCFFPNDPSGIDDLVHCLLQERPALVVLEARAAAMSALPLQRLPLGACLSRSSTPVKLGILQKPPEDLLRLTPSTLIASLALPKQCAPSPGSSRMRRPCSSGRFSAAEGSSLACSSLRTTASVQPLPSR